MAVKIEGALEDDGLQVWLDHSEIRLGTLLRNELQTAEPLPWPNKTRLTTPQRRMIRQ
jgi:hypothetical protein